MDFHRAAEGIEAGERAVKTAGTALDALAASMEP
jgi:hypothetical protein